MRTTFCALRNTGRPKPPWPSRKYI